MSPQPVARNQGQTHETHGFILCLLLWYPTARHSHHFAQIWVNGAPEARNYGGPGAELCLEPSEDDAVVLERRSAIYPVSQQADWYGLHRVFCTPTSCWIMGTCGKRLDDEKEESDQWTYLPASLLRVCYQQLLPTRQSSQSSGKHSDDPDVISPRVLPYLRLPSSF